MATLQTAARAGHLIGIFTHLIKNEMLPVAQVFFKGVKSFLHIREELDVLGAIEACGMNRVAFAGRVSEIAASIEYSIVGCRESLLRIESTMRDMLSLTGLGENKKVLIPAKERIGEICKKHEVLAARHGVVLDVDVSALLEEDAIFMSEVRFRDALSNVIINGIQSFSEDHKGARNVRVKVWALNEKIYISVVDNGKGISEEKLRGLLAGPVVSDKPMGTGFGLLAVKEHVESGKGKIKIESRVGEGTNILYVFDRLECEANKEECRTEEIKLIAPQLAALMTVLVLDDYEPALKVTAGNLEEMGFKVLSFTDPEKVFESLRKGNFPDIAIIDQTLSNGSQGVDLIGKLFKMQGSNKTHFVLYTGSVLANKPEDDRVRRLVGEYGISYIRKGMDLEGFCRTVSIIAEAKIKELPKEKLIAAYRAVVERPCPFVGWQVYDFMGLVIHKMSNFLLGLQNVKNMELGESMITCINDLKGFVESLRLFVREGRELENTEDPARTSIPLMLQDRQELKDLWRGLAPGARYKLAVITELYLRAGIWNLMLELEGMTKSANTTLSDKQKTRLAEIASEISRIDMAVLGSNPDLPLARKFLRYFKILREI